MSITELANMAFVSTSSVLRFAQKLGFKGYSDFKYSINWRDSPKKLTNKINGQLLGNNLTELIKEIDNESIQTSIKYIKESRRIFIIASGLDQQNQAKDFQQQFLKLGINMIILPATSGSDLNRQIAESVTGNDLLIIFSSSGENKVIKSFLKIPILNRVPIISFSINLNNWLSMNANCAFTLERINNEELQPFFPSYMHFLINYLSIRYEIEYK